MSSNTKPPGKRTGYSHPKCYARDLADCTAKRSFEHYYSENLLNRFGDEFLVRGLPSIPRGEQKRRTASTMGARILCERHNWALSPLDTMIGRFWDALIQIQTRSPSAPARFDGHDLERWALKVFLGKLVSGNVRTPSGMPSRIKSVPLGYVRILFGEQELTEGCGFYYTGKCQPDSRPDGLNTYLRANKNDDGSIGDTYAIDIELGGFPWITTFLCPLTTAEQSQWYRPRGFVVQGQGVIELSWQGTSSDYLNLVGVPFTREASRV